jgi:hypothetical protein
MALHEWAFVRERPEISIAVLQVLWQRLADRDTDGP